MIISSKIVTGTSRSVMVKKPLVVCSILTRRLKHRNLINNYNNMKTVTKDLACSPIWKSEWDITVFNDIWDPRPILAGQIKKKKEQSTYIKRDEINIINIINDNTFNLHNMPLTNNNRYMKVTLKFKQIGIARSLISADDRGFKPTYGI